MILDNLQKGIVDNTISTAAGLEKGSPYSSPYQALPCYKCLSHQSTSQPRKRVQEELATFNHYIIIVKRNHTNKVYLLCMNRFMVWFYFGAQFGHALYSRRLLQFMRIYFEVIF